MTSSRSASHARLPIHVTIAVTALLVAFGGCRKPPRHTQPRLVLVYAPCTVSRHYMSPYDPSVPYTPNLARLGSRGVVFERHHTESGSSGTAYASLFSGGHADLHHVFKHPRVLRDELLLLPEVFAAAGYETFSWLSQVMASTKLNYGQGVPPENSYDGASELGADERFRSILDRLEREPDYKAFVVANFTVTHGPYEGLLLDEFCEKYAAQCQSRGDDLPKYKALAKSEHRPLSLNYPFAVERLGLTDYDERRLREVNELLYKADMYRLDKLFGQVIAEIDEAGVFDESLIVFTSDHGELLYRDNALLKWWHGYQLVPEVTNISLLASGPGSGLVPGRYDGVTRSVDVLPTMAGLAGIDIGETYAGSGEDLSGALRATTPAPELIAFSHSALVYAPVRASPMQLLSSYFAGPDPSYMWISARRGDDYYKLHRSPDDQWAISKYDLAIDPTETNDLFDEADDDDRGMAERIRTYKEGLNTAAYNVLAPRLPRQEAIEMLRSMGYID